VKYSLYQEHGQTAFTFQEVLDNKVNLFYCQELSNERLEELYNRFGGSIRRWVQSTEDEVHGKSW